MRLHAVALPLALLLVAPASAPAQGGPSAAGSLPAFGSARELTTYLRTLLPEPPAAVRCTTKKVAVARGSRRAGDPGRTGAAVIEGRVRDAAGSPLGGAHVSAWTTANAVVTAADGAFRLTVPAESLARRRSVPLRVRRIGYEQRRHDVPLRRGDSLRVEFTLCPQTLQLSSMVVTAAASADESVTNVQQEGVDEGGIVKLHGDHLVILRRGRLFTVAIGDDDLRPVDVVDAFPPGSDPHGAWYDEMLVHGDKVVVIGYSYLRHGTELNVFGIERTGALRYLATYHLRSNDYYSSRNYASRLVDGKLVFYTPLYLPYRIDDLSAVLPALRTARGTGDSAAFVPIVTPHRVYRARRDANRTGGLALHTVTVCSLDGEPLACRATVVVGPPGRTFHVSSRAVYVWVSEWGRHGSAQRMLYRMPLDGSRPGAIGVAGSPVDQFSFLEDDDGFVNVLVRSEGAGDAMWMAHAAGGSVALLRLPIAALGDGSADAPLSRYRSLPMPSGGDFQNRFVGDVVVYGSGSGWGMQRGGGSELYVVPRRGGDAARLELPHGTDRIEAMGEDALVVGSDGLNLHFSGVRLASPAVSRHFVLAGAAQGELRSHGFFYKASTSGGGTLGLPVRQSGRPGYEHLFRESASILFLRNEPGRFTEIGRLESHPESARDDGCRASCVDWYGNARPLFLRGRTLALLGYELVEGRVLDGRIAEVRRVVYSDRR